MTLGVFPSIIATAELVVPTDYWLVTLHKQDIDYFGFIQAYLNRYQ